MLGGQEGVPYGNAQFTALSTFLGWPCHHTMVSSETLVLAIAGWDARGNQVPLLMWMLCLPHLPQCFLNTMKVASSSLRAQCQHQCEISAFQCATPRPGCPAETLSCFPPNPERQTQLYPFWAHTTILSLIAHGSALRTTGLIHPRKHIFQQPRWQTADWETPRALVLVWHQVTSLLKLL